MAHIWCERGDHSVGSLKTKDTQCSHIMHSFMFFPLLTCGFSVPTPELLKNLCEQIGGPFKRGHRPISSLLTSAAHSCNRGAAAVSCVPFSYTLRRWARWCEMWMESEQAVCDRESMCCRALSLIATRMPNDSWSTLLLDCSPKRRRHVHSEHYPSAPSALFLPLLESKIPPLPPQWPVIFCLWEMCAQLDYPRNTRTGLVCVLYHQNQLCAWVFYAEWQCKKWAVASLF